MLKLDRRKISFDFDGVLTNDRGRLLAKKFINEGAMVYIVTSRNESQGAKVRELADVLGVRPSRVIFTKDKPETIKRLKINVHYDNNPDTVKAIRAINRTAILFHN